MSKAESPDSELGMSSISTRRVKPELLQKVNKLNTEVKIFCRNNQSTILDDSNLDVKCHAGDNCTLSNKEIGYFHAIFSILEIIIELHILPPVKKMIAGNQ